jgi:hypothetical protein
LGLTAARLTKLGPLAHDTTERVRVAMADLLLTVKSLPDMRCVGRPTRSGGR